MSYVLARRDPTACIVENARWAALQTMLELAAEKGVSLIVTASHGRRGLERLLLGSQTQEVVSRSSAPVLVVI